MRSNFLVLIFFTMLVPFLLQAQTTAVPDSNFEEYLETHAADGSLVSVGDATSMGDGVSNNGVVLTSGISDVLSLNVNGLDIANLSGIEGFTSLETLVCSNNKLMVLNISNNTNLKSLLCASNQLTDLLLSSNTSLETLNCSNNQLQNLDVSNNIALKSLSCSGNQLSQINLDSNPDLALLNVSNNKISGDFAVGNNLDLESLFCASNQISTLNLLSNTALKTLNASNNSLTNLDLSAINTKVCPDPQTNPLTICQGVASINVSQNQLTTINVSNGFNDLVSTFNAEGNPDLFCIQIDSGFNPPTNWKKDDWTYYSETTCTDIYTYVPDDNFEQALIDLSYDDVLDNLVLTSNINTVASLNVSSKSIVSLVGIEDFIALETLDCSSNQIEDFNAASNTSLLQINCANNNLTSLNLDTNTLLTTIDCANNALTSLDLSANSALLNLNCSNNSLSGLDVNSNVLLNDLDCSFNQIKNLNLTLNTALNTLLCNDNSLLALNVKNGNNNAISILNASNNTNLFCIEVDNVANANAALGWQKDAAASYNLGCGTYIPDDNFEQALIDQGIDSDGTLNNYVATADINAITTLTISGLNISDLTGIQDFAALQNLNCSNNSISDLDLSNNTSLVTLNCSVNQIEDLNLTLNTALNTLLCNNNTLFTLNIKNGNNILLTTFNATNNSNLFCINVDNAILGSIPGGWQKDTFASYNGDCNGSRFTAIPDNNFEQALIDFGLDSGPLDNQVLTSNIEHVESLNINDNQIADLAGIQDFKSLKELDCSGNYLNTLDVSGMINLEQLNCSSNYLLTNNIAAPNGLLNLTGTLNLLKLFCASNNLNSLDTTANINLETLDCADNNLDILNVSGNTALKILNCPNNKLTNLDISNNVVLEEVNCNNNKISSFTGYALNNATLQILSCNNNALSNLPVNRYLALKTMNCRSNSLNQLDVNSNTMLEILDFSVNNVSSINLTNNGSLKEVLVSQNQLSQLDVSSNTLLEHLNCDYNQIMQLVLSSNTLLKYLICSNNQITDLDLSNNADLIEANLSSNSMSSLTLSSTLGELKIFNASNNQLTDGIDLSTMGTNSCPANDANCPETITINVSNNQLKFLNIQNGINTDILNFNATNNPNLTCIQVDDVNSIGGNWQKDATTQYSLDCRFGETYVPDDNFEQALINHGYDVAPLDDYVPTANIEGLLSLDVSGNAIADLTGIQDFEALQNLNCSNNILSVLDLSLNTNLTEIDCSNNSLSDLDFSENTMLTILNCSQNSLADVDLTNNVNLVSLNISNNSFVEFIASDISNLAVFKCDFNQITDLDFQLNTALTSLSCASNALETLNIKNGQNSNLSNLNAQNNAALFCIETDTGAIPASVTWVKDATASFSVNCHYRETYVPDDAFEQALIDFGYDTVLDDYVLTDNINGITYLDVSNKNISDLTGIEDFTGLTVLKCDGNTLSVIDLSNNILLVELNLSNNQLSEIDVSSNVNLKILMVSNNSLAQLDLALNTSLTKLNVSANALTSLQLATLVNLVELDCSFNLLESLNVSASSNLTKVYCQSNLLISDQLNIQNGTNQNITVLNATDNPDLRCVLVDNPFAIITNADGTYDNWKKDATANYQTVCDDADNDGVANANDKCLNTPFGDAVDLFGCSIINLPNDNFTILITGETCLNNNDGKINIVTKQYYNYTAVLTRENFSKEYHFTTDIDMLNLLAGTYKMCITIEEWPNYESCYDIVISQPEPLDVIANRSADGKKIVLEMSGSSNYNIEFNGLTFSTSKPTLELNLQNGKNALKISTNAKCQGVYEEDILLSDKIRVYPNPFNSIINIYNGSDSEEITVNINSYLGQQVYSRTFKNPNEEVQIETGFLAQGMYTIAVQSKQALSTFKIVKK